MKPFVLKQHDSELGRIEELRAEELGAVSGAGPLMCECPGGGSEDITITAGGGPAQGDGCP
jgi:hypothetical protein